MKKLFALFTLLAVVSLFLAACGPTLAESAPTATPTVEKRKPTETPTDPPPNQVSPTTAPTSAPALPSPFDITLAITNLTCGSGATQEHPYTFTIDGTSLSLLQVDADITTTGTYDPATGEFATSAVVGPGTEAYSGVIAFDGTTITVTGENSYTQSGQCTYTGTVTGTTTVP